MEPVTPIDILAIDKKALVKQSNLLQRFPPRHPKPSVKNLDIHKPVMIKVAHEEAA
jgi:hypothetical protein